MLRKVLAKVVPPGGTIGIVAPASPHQHEKDVEQGIAWWETQGYQIKLAENALQPPDYAAGPAEMRAKDLMTTFADPSIDAIQCLRGGYGADEIIPYLDFDLIAANPKAFIGYSDITFLHMALLKFANLVTFQGPGLRNLSQLDKSSFTGDRLLRVLRGETTGPVPADPDNPNTITIAPGQATGRLVGGNLSSLMYTLGTPWEFNLDDAIFVFEDVQTNPSIDSLLLALMRRFRQLIQAGKFARLRGIVVGQMTGYHYPPGQRSHRPFAKTLEEVLEEYLGSLDVPVFYGLPIGHGTHKATIPFGVEATIDAHACTLTITEPALRNVDY